MEDLRARVSLLFAFLLQLYTFVLRCPHQALMENCFVLLLFSASLSLLWLLYATLPIRLLPCPSLVSPLLCHRTHNWCSHEGLLNLMKKRAVSGGVTRSTGITYTDPTLVHNEFRYRKRIQS